MESRFKEIAQKIKTNKDNLYVETSENKIFCGHESRIKSKLEIRGFETQKPLLDEISRI